jgi:hypothetical protein
MAIEYVFFKLGAFWKTNPIFWGVLGREKNRNVGDGEVEWE